RDAALLKKRISQRNIDAEEERVKQAQTHILSLDLEKHSSDLILELGFFILSKAVLPSSFGAIKDLSQKFPLREGTLLVKYAEKNLPLNSEKTVLRYEKEIGEALSALEGENK
ncbi:MAG: hypothetical protein Q7T11_00245, partial [Deltaproteobacteria bacterium]|nr:hypothetical protein [Deltaproteobacteria bacterium]